MEVADPQLETAMRVAAGDSSENPGKDITIRGALIQMGELIADRINGIGKR